jgi:hypothetical protein
MKTFTLLFTLFYYFNALAAAPYGIKGQQQTSTLYSNVHQFPNNLVTNMGGIDALVETGNNNILSNPSFEHLTVSSGWTDSGTDTGIATAVAVVNGKKAIGFLPVARSVNLTQSSTLYASQFADGVQGLAMVRIKSDVAVKVCSIQAGVVSTTNCVTTNTDLKWGLYKVPFILGGTSNGISISTNGTLVTGTVIVDDAFVGATDLSQNISACQTVDCTTTFTVNVAAAGAINSQTLNWLSGCTNVSGTVGCTFSTEMQASTISGLSCVGNRVGSGGGTATVLAGNSSTTGFSFTSGTTTSNVTVYTCVRQGTDYVAAMGRSNGNTYSSNNADTDWASCGHTTSDFTGFGTVSAIETQCKRQGGDLLIKGKFTSGTSTAVEARLALKFNGSTLTSKSSAIIPTIQKAGDLTFSVFFAGSAVTLIEPSVAYMTFGAQGAAQAGLTKSTGVGYITTGQLASFDARIPINGWENSNIIIGSFNGLQSCVDTKSCTDTFSAKVSSAGVISDENVDWINGNASLTTSTYTLSFNSSIFTVAPNCTYVTTENNNLIHVVGVSNSPSNVVVRSARPDTGAALVGSFQIICQKQGADYIGKTAMAVASDQNDRSPGIVGVKTCHYAFGGASATLASPTVCSTGTCVEVYDSCGTGTPPVFGSTGNYTGFSFASGTFANSTYVDCRCTSFTTSIAGLLCSTYFNTSGNSWSSNSTGGIALAFASFNTTPAAINSHLTFSCKGQAP